MPVNVSLVYALDQEQSGDYFHSIMPQGLTTLAPWLEQQGHQVSLVNMARPGYSRVIKYLREKRPQVVGLSLFTHNRHVTLQLASDIKRELPGTYIVAGGHHATFLHEEISRHNSSIDVFIKGEGEEAFLRVLEQVEQGSPPSGVEEGTRISNLDVLPWPSSFGGEMLGVDTSEQYKYLVTSRGCPWNCTYCASPAFWKRKVTWRNPASMVEEISSLYHDHGIIYLAIRDDNFVLDKKRVIEFSHLMARQPFKVMWNCQGRLESVDQEMLCAMKQAGLEHIQYGAESGSPGILERYDKKITPAIIEEGSRLTRNCGLALSLYFMTGMEGEGPGDIRASEQVIKHSRPDDIVVSPVALYPGTQLSEKYEKNSDLWFTSREQGIFLRQDRQSRKWPGQLARAMEQVPGREPGEYLSSAMDCDWVGHILAGDLYRYQENYKAADKHYGKVLDHDSSNVWGYLKSGKNAFEQGDLESASGHMAQVRKMVPRFPLGYIYGAQVLEHAGDRKAALALVQKGLTFNKTSFDLVDAEKRLK